MSESRFDFCPRCGAVARDGKCQSCGYVNEKIQREMELATAKRDVSGAVWSAESATGKKPKSRSFWLIAVIVLLIVGFSIEMIAAEDLIVDEYASYYSLFEKIGNVNPEAVSAIGTQPGVTPKTSSLLESMWEDPIFFLYEDSEKMHADGYDYYDRGTDCYYFDDYISTDVKYDVMKRSFGYSNDDNWMAEYGYDFPNNLYMYGEFYELENTGLENEKEINDFLYQMSTYGAAFYDSDKDYLGEGDGYYTEAYETITYMNDTTVSVLVEIYGYVVTDIDTDEEDYIQTSSTLLGVVIDIEQGCTLKAADLFEIDKSFTINFFEEAKRQNDFDLYDKYTVDEVFSDFANGDLMFVYTPLGAEFCYAYPDYSGYITYTCTDYLKYLKKD